MAKATSFRCKLLTPEAALLDEAVQAAVLTAHDGEVGVLPNRAPLLTKLGTGQLRVQASGSTRRFFIDGGFAQVLDNELNVLTTRAQAAQDIDVQAAEKELEALRQQVPASPEERAQRSADLRRCRARLKVARAQHG
jgi:F-type H+-transporting ATPase subunit epsilon